MMKERRRNRRGEGEHLREEILRAAERLLISSGDAGAVSIRAVASAVGVTPPSIYLHYRDKGELLYAVCGEHFRRLGEASDAAVRGVDDPLERIRVRGRAYIQFGLENPEHYRIMFMARPDTDDPRMTVEELAATACFGDLQDDVRAAMDSGLLPAGDVFTVACGLWARVHGVTSLLIAKPDFPWPPLEEFVAAVTASPSVPERG
jgi:AcrR family transcriptional regulator